MHLPMCPGLPGALTLALTLTLQEIDSKDERIGDLTNVRCKRYTLGALCKRPHDAPRLAGKLQATRGALQVCASIRPIPLKVTAPPPHMYIHYLPPHRVHRARTDPTPHRAATRLASPRLTSPHITSPQRYAAARPLRPCAPEPPTLAAGRSEVKNTPSLSSIAGSSSAAAGMGVSSPQTPGATGDSPHSPHTEASEGREGGSGAPPADAAETQRYQTVTRAALQAKAEKSRKAAVDDTALLQQQGFDE
jgi:hypothetical protein